MCLRISCSLSNAAVSSKVGLRGLTVHSTTKSEIVAVALTMKEPVLCSNTMKQLGFRNALRPRTAVHRLHLGFAHRRESSPRVKLVALCTFSPKSWRRRQNQHPLRKDLGSTCSHRYRVPEQAHVPLPPSADQSIRGLKSSTLEPQRVYDTKGKAYLRVLCFFQFSREWGSCLVFYME